MIKKTTFDTKVVVLHPHSQKYRSHQLFGSLAVHLGPSALRLCIAAGLPLYGEVYLKKIK